MSYIEKKFFKEGQNETSNQIDIFKNKSTGDLMFRDPLGEEILITPQGGLAPIINNLPTGPAYKVYTALLTQSGGDDPLGENGGIWAGNYPELVIGRTYYIADNFQLESDFTNVGAPNNNVGTYFVATGTTPASWGTYGLLQYNTGAPVVKVLENTIGNVWFTYNREGMYGINSGGLFFENKSWSINVLISQASIYSFLEWRSFNEFRIETINGTPQNKLLLNTPIEIRVYN
jgi:hypothetical protein